MKKITFLVAIMMLTVSMAFSQIEATHLKQAKEFPAKHVLTNVGAALCDTVVPLSFMTGTCYDSLTLYYAAANPDSGFFTGECYYKFPALAMRYTATVGSTISDAFVMLLLKLEQLETLQLVFTQQWDRKQYRCWFIVRHQRNNSKKCN